MKARTLALLLVLPLSPACSSPPETKVVQGTAIEHGEALFHDASLAKNSLNTYSCATCHEATPGEAARVALAGAPLAGALKRSSYWGGQEL
jgi:thiosulfate dehydrogenase